MCRNKKQQKCRIMRTVLLSTLLATILLCACGKEHTRIETGNNSSTSSVEQSNGSALHMLTKPGTSLRPCTQTENGFYEIVSHREMGINVVYTDYETKSRVYLCNDPGCKHDSESCASYLPMRWAETLFTDGSYLYVEKAATNGDDPSECGQLLRMGLDGSNREVLVEMNSGEQLKGAFASDGKKLYYTTMVYLETKPDEKEETDHISMQLSCIDLSTKEVTNLYDFGTDCLWKKVWVGCVGREMIFCEKTLPDPNDKNKIAFTYRAFNVDTQNWRDITEEPIFEGNGIWADGSDIWISKDGKTIHTLDYNTGEIYQVELERDIPQKAEIWFARDGKLLVSWTEENGEQYVAVDTQTGVVTNALETVSGTSGKTNAMDVLAVFGDEYLVETDSKEVPSTFFNMDGSVERYTDEVWPQALIKKEDYWAGNKNLTMIDDHVN